MKHLTLGKVQEIISLSNNIGRPQDGWNEIMNRIADGEDINELLKMTPEEQALVDYISLLSDPEKAELLALVWLGRGEGSWPDGWDSLVDHAQSIVPHAEYYLAEKVPLSEYLENGINQMRDIS